MLVRTFDAKKFDVELARTENHQGTCWSYLHPQVATPLYNVGDGPVGRYMAILAGPASFLDGPDGNTLFVDFLVSDGSTNANNNTNRPPISQDEIGGLSERLGDFRGRVIDRGASTNSEVITHGIPVDSLRGMLYIPKSGESWDNVKSSFQKSINLLAGRQGAPPEVQIFQSGANGTGLHWIATLEPSTTPAQPSTAPNSTRPVTETARPAPQLGQDRL
ncbi:hypothetical protein, partial [Actinoplanes derwentensis]|uniref:hypothetical protein n=1 Tax=Actinoplanes derwentensis TaxID=113562 RepID=UPI0019404175